MEVILLILSYLPLSDILMCGLVCKLWQNLAKLKIFHRRTWLYICDKNMFPNGIMKAIKNTIWVSVHKLYIYEVDLKDLMENCREDHSFFSRLTSLTFCYCHTDGHSIISILRQCNNLQCLKICTDTWKDTFLTQNTDQEVLRSSLINVKKFILIQWKRDENEIQIDFLFIKLVDCLLNLNSMNIDYEFENGSHLRKIITSRAHQLKSLKLGWLLPNKSSLPISLNAFNNLQKFAINVELENFSYEKLVNLRFCFDRFQLDMKCFRELSSLEKLLLQHCEPSSWKDCFINLGKLKSFSLLNMKIPNTEFIEGIKSSNIGTTLTCLTLRWVKIDYGTLCSVSTHPKCQRFKIAVDNN